MSRKIFLTEGVARASGAMVGAGAREALPGEATTRGRKVRRILDKSARCGVSLSVAEAGSLGDFVGGAV